MADDFEQSPPITVLHVSDMQFGYKHRFGRLGLADPADAEFDTLFARLREDLERLNREHGLTPNVLVVSGDLAEWGLKSEFQTALDFVKQLTELLALPRRQVIIVPGNHDINRSACEAYFKECESDEVPPVAPFWPKWKHFYWLFQEFYRDEKDLVFAQDQPYTWWELPELKLAIAGFNSTMAEVHGPDERFPDYGHFGRCGESQLRWFAERVKTAAAKGWFRLGVVHHNLARGPENDDENLRDADDFKRLVARSLNLVLHGHTHFGALNWLDRDVPAISTGSSGLDRSVRPEEVPCQYQILQILPDKIIRSTRAYNPTDKRWIGDTSCSESGNEWQSEITVTFRGANAVFPSIENVSRERSRARRSPEAKLDDEFADSGVAVDDWGLQAQRAGRLTRRDDFLALVAEVFRLREQDAQVVEVRDHDSGIDYLRATTRGGPVMRHFPIAAAQSFEPPDAHEYVRQFRTTIDAQFRAGNPTMISEIVYGGARVAQSLIDESFRSGIRLLSFAEYQGLIDFGPYVTEQTRRLEVDPIYPPRLYVPQRYFHHNGNQRTPGADVIEQVYQWLGQPEARFVLVLGDFGTGKTFLLHEVARQMPDRLPNLTPVLIEMRALEKGHPMEVLVSMHMIDMGEERFDVGRFRHMMQHGRVCLLFDGFDELALRLTYDRAAEHLATLVDAAQGQAKVVVTSRTQHFLSEQQVKQALYSKIESVAARRLVELRPFDRDQVREFLVHAFQAAAEQAEQSIDRSQAERQAERRLEIICNVEDLQGLSANPRMLSFIAELDEQDLLQARDPQGKVTAADLYRLILDRWLDGEVRRRSSPGGLKTLEKEHLWTAVTNLALRMWETGQRSVGLSELTDEAKGAISDIHTLNMTADEAAFEIGSGSLLVRERDGQFAFVHRSVMEWLVASDAASAVKTTSWPAVLQDNEISKLMADYLIGLVGVEAAGQWAREALDAGTEDRDGWLKKNALLVHQRIRELPKPTGGGLAAPVISLDFAHQNLRGRDFAQQVLRGSNFGGADLTEAVFTKADLRGANLTSAVLAGANLMGADVRDVKVSKPSNSPLENWRRAKLIGAKIPKDILACADLWGAARPDAQPELMTSATFSPIAVALTKAGGILATAHSDGTVRLWDTDSGTELRVLQGNTGTVRSVAFAADGRMLASASYDRSVRLWDTDSGTVLRTLQGHTGPVRSVAFAADGRLLASASDDQSVRLWDTDSGKELRVLQAHSGAVNSVAFAAEGRMLASASDDKSVRLWDTDSGKELRVLQGHTRTVRSAAFAADGRMLASASDDQSVRLWDTDSGVKLHVLQGHTGPVNSVDFAADGRMLASASDDRSVRLWDTSSGTVLHMLQGHTGWVRSVAFAADGRLLASASSDGSVRFWDTDSGKALRMLQGNTRAVNSVAFAADGRMLASASDDRTVRLWDTDSGKERRMLQGHTGSVNCVAFAADGRMLASASTDGSVRLWDTDSGTELRVLQGNTGTVYSVAFAADGRMLASASYDQSVRLWDTESGTVLRMLQGHTGSVNSVAFAAEGRMLASASDDKSVRLWDTDSGKELRVLQGHTRTVRSVDFAADGRMLASASDDRTVRLWDTDSGKVLRMLQGNAGWVGSVAFAADGRSLASASSDGSVRLWDTDSGKVLRMLQGNAGWVGSVAFAANGRMLASASYDGTVRYWEVETGRLLATLIPLDDGWAAVLPDGRYKLVGNPGGRFWWAAGMCRFEPGELDAYVPSIQPMPLDSPLF